MKIIITEDEKKHIKSLYGIINESTIEGRRCKVYNEVARGTFQPSLNQGAGSIQEFLIRIGYNITKDYVFGNKTATALGTWVYGKSKGIDTVDKFWNQMKKDGWDVGATTGYGPKMVIAISTMLQKICHNLAVSCQLDYEDIDSTDDYEIKKHVRYKFDKILEEAFKKAINYWKNYLNNPKVQQKIYNNMTFGETLGDYLSFDSVIEKYLTALKNIESSKYVPCDKTECEGAAMQAPEYGFSISVNYDYYLNNHKYEIIDNGYVSKDLVKFFKDDVYSAFVHEIQHKLWSLVKPLNSSSSIKQAFPAAVDVYYGDINKDDPMIIDTTLSNIPSDSKSELISYGIDIQRLLTYIKRPTDLGFAKVSNTLQKQYSCDENEKISNLEGYRAVLTDKGIIKYGGDIPISVFSDDLNFMKNGKYVSTDFKLLITCWVKNRFQPKLSVFLKELNELAKKSSEKIEKNYKNPNTFDKTEIT